MAVSVQRSSVQMCAVQTIVIKCLYIGLLLLKCEKKITNILSKVDVQTCTGPQIGIRNFLGSFR
jgi:hypothetical protein